MAGDADKLVAESRCDEPAAHHHALVLRGSYLRDERDADGRKQQLGKGQDEVSADEQVGVEVIDVVGVVGCRQANAADRHEQIGTGSNEHAETNLDGSLGLFALLAKPTEEGDADGRQGYHEARVELLEDGGVDRHDLACRLYIIIIKYSRRADDEQSVDDLRLRAAAAEQTADAVDDEDAPNEVHHVELHAGDARGGASRELICKPCQGQTVLMERHPEEDDYGKDEAEADDALLRLGRREAICFSCSGRLLVLL